jgi:hypothetical protein
MTSIYLKFDVPIYEAKVYIIVADDFGAESQTRRWASIFEDAVFTVSDIATCAYHGNVTALLLNPKYINMNTLAHEILHLTFRILEWREIRVNNDNQEPAAYLNGWLWERIEKVLKKRGFLK